MDEISQDAAANAFLYDDDVQDRICGLCTLEEYVCLGSLIAAQIW